MVRRWLLFASLTCACTSAGGASNTPPPTGDARPPSRPATTREGGATRWFAIDVVKLGFSPRDSASKDPSAWKSYGFNLDRRFTTADDSRDSVNSCRRRNGSLTKFLQDGNQGIDNNFGQHVLWTIETFKPGAEEFVNDGIRSGRYALILRLDNVTSEDNARVPGMLYLGGDFAAGKARPQFTAADRWPINPLSLADGKTIARPKVVFERGYIREGHWVSGDLGTETIDLGPMLSGSDVSLPVDSAVIVVKLDGTMGTIAGAVSTAKLQSGLSPVARRLGLCDGDAAYQEVLKTLSLAADLVSGAPSLQDVTRECDAISLGYGFTMKPTGEPTALMASATEPAPNVCPDAGP